MNSAVHLRFSFLSFYSVWDPYTQDGTSHSQGKSSRLQSLKAPSQTCQEVCLPGQSHQVDNEAQSSQPIQSRHLIQTHHLNRKPSTLATPQKSVSIS